MASFEYLGTSIGASNIYNAPQGTSTQVTVSGLPTNGSLIYVRLWYRTINGWALKDLIYTSCSGACTNLPHLSIQKTSAIIADGINVSNPKRIPGAIVEYTITVINSGFGSVDANSVVINDSIPPDTEYVAASLQFISNTSGLNSTATLSDTGGNIQVTPLGTFLAANSSVNPTFSVKFRVKVK
ncbi:MAG: hypothetical protein V3V19_00040 [Cocleimonas sp.]